MADLEARLPVHSIPPAMIAEMDELDDELNHARLRLAEMIKLLADHST